MDKQQEVEYNSMADKLIHPVLGKGRIKKEGELNTNRPDPCGDTRKLVDNNENLYLEFACTACIRGGGCSAERALQVLDQSDGNIKLAIEQLVKHRPQPTWTEDDVARFRQLILIHGKNFSLISRDLTTKTVKQCVEFYYLWKKSATAATMNSVSESPENHRLLRGHEMRVETRAETTTLQLPQQPPQTPLQPGVEQFPCKVCGRIFLKIKSRSAHMKRHKNER